MPLIKDLKINIPIESLEKFKQEGLTKLEEISSEISYKIEEDGDTSKLVLSWGAKMENEKEESLFDEVEKVLESYGIPLTQSERWGENR